VPGADDRDVCVLVLGENARSVARSLRAGPLRVRAVRDGDHAAALLGLAPHSYDALVLTGPSDLTDAEGEDRTGGTGDQLGELRGLIGWAGGTLVYVLAAAGGHGIAEGDVVRLLDAGADDVIMDPLSPAVLAARIRARRRRGITSGSDRTGGLLGDLVIDRPARRCLIRNHEVSLRAKELDLLDALATQAGRVVSRSMLMSVVWDEHWFRSTKTLDVTMAGLRRQLREVAEAVGGVVPEIMTIRGVGYRLDPPGRVDLARAR
jgi:DNA-binding winged helix-turn-helix (wHTH) protein